MDKNDVKIDNAEKESEILDKNLSLEDENKEDNQDNQDNEPKEETEQFMGIVYDKKLEVMLDFFKNNVKRKGHLPSFLKHSSSFSKSSKQGILGTLSIEGKDDEAVYKISQNFNFIIEQESTVMKSLNEIRNYCPHFCKFYKKTVVTINNNFREVENPFELSKEKMIKEDMLLMEKIENSRKLYRYIKKETFDENILMSMIKQVLMGVAIAQQEKKLTHYDLHSNNVMIKKCDINSCFLYRLDDNNIFLIPTYGYCPVIIDFGFSYIGDMEKNPLYGVLAHTKIGFTSDRYDPVSDPKLFLNTIASELNIYRKETDIIKKFNMIVDKIYEPLTIEKESGWDENPKFKNASDVVAEILDKELNNGSKFFKKYGEYCLDMMQSIITLPLKSKPSGDLKKYFRILMEEFGKIENELSSDFANLYIFKKMVVSAIKLKKDWIKNTPGYIKEFKYDMYEAIDDVSKFCSPKKLDFEKLLCACIATSQCMEGILYETMNFIAKEKQEEYNRMKVKDVKDIFRVIDDSIESPFVFDKKTKIYVFDCKKKKTISYHFKSEEEINDMNDCSSDERAILLNEIINSHED